LAGKSTKKPSLASQFLAAPEEVVSDPRELAKLRDRKAQDDARVARERAGKKKNRPSLEDVLADVVRVAQEEATNPFHKFRSISRRRYELYGHYPIEFVLEHGRFEHIKQMAGLADAVGTRLLLHARTNESIAAHNSRYFRRYVLPHVGKFPEIQRATAKATLAVAIGDTHSTFMDPFAWVSFCAFLKDAQPEIVLWIGDHIDGAEISRHPKVPGHTNPLQLELDMQRAMMTEARALAPRARFVLVPDNHFWDRMVSYLTQVAPGHAGLSNLRIDELLGLEALDVELAPSGSFLAPGTDQRPALRIHDRYIATHGTRLGAHPAHGELVGWGTSGVSGHVHRHQLAMGPTAGLAREQWMCLPGGVIDEVAKYYVKGPGPAWSQGWGTIETCGAALQMTPVVVSGGVAMAHGWHYTAKRPLPAGVEAVRKFWLERFRLA
jgi:hypothetical protein